MKALFVFMLSAVMLSVSGCNENNVSVAETSAAHAVDEVEAAQKNNDLIFGTLTDLTHDESVNPVPYIAPQCYTNPVDGDHTYNPCYACHTESKSPNFLNDTDVQTDFVFPEPGVINRWENLFKDRSKAVAEMPDDAITDYVKEDNYFTKNGEIILAEKLEKPPEQWDRNNNGQWDGFIPDAYFNFDSEGFDVAPNGQDTGWRVYAYYPFPGTFMPTNGSTDDVMIRLPEIFRQDENNQYSREIYKINLAIIEAMMKKENVSITEFDENKIGVDLDKNGKLNKANKIVFLWNPLKNQNMTYVGKAKKVLADGGVHMAAGLLPEGTEFLHSVRYLDAAGDVVGMATRMKELRYAKKSSWRNYFQLRRIVEKEIKERHDFPDRTKMVTGNMEVGLNVPHGWTYQGFIEDDAGQLRPQTYEETYFCVGCHGYTGASNDTVLSFVRKFDSSQHQQGWYHWMQKSFAGVHDPIREDGRGEFEFYLENNPTGNEYRTNEEVFNKFFNSDGSKKSDAFERLKTDISFLMLPSKDRANTLNKAYKIIVDEQSFVKGRESIVKPLETVYHEVEVDQPTGIKKILSHY